jgi:hypothetical protein
MMAEHRSDVPDVDPPEPEEALSGTAARTSDHEPTDLDDREVQLDDPAERDVPIDDDATFPPTGSAA